MSIWDRRKYTQKASPTETEEEVAPVSSLPPEEYSYPANLPKIPEETQKVSLTKESRESSAPKRKEQKPVFITKDAIADISAMIMFSTPVAMGIDMLCAGATLQQAIIARLIALPVNITTSRLYGKFRDRIFEICKLDSKTPLWKRYIVDSLAMVTFQGSLYAGILAGSGLISGKLFSASNIQAATGTVMIFMLAIGGPYGRFRNLVRRKLFGLATQD